MRCIFGTTNTNPRPVKFHRKNSNENSQSTPEKRHSLGSITPTKSSSGYQSSVSERISMIESSSSLESITEQTNKRLEGIYHSEVNGSLTSPSKLKTSHVMRSHSDAVNDNRNWKRSSPVRYVQAFRFMVGPGHCPMISKYGPSLSKAVGPVDPSFLVVKKSHFSYSESSKKYM